MTALQDSQLKSSMRCAKYMLITVSFMFAITAVLLIMVGTAIQTIFGDFQQFIDDHFTSPPILLIAIGFILLAVAILGVYGAIKQSVLVINLYGVCLFLVFILEISAAITAFVMQTQVRNMLIRTMMNGLQEYQSNEYMAAGVDFMQTNLECCGVVNPVDWEPYYNQEPTQLYPNNVTVPNSCCGHFTFDNECDTPYQYGCLRRMDFIISQSTMLIATGALTVAFVQLLGVLCAFMLAKTLRRNKSLREARRWQLQQSLGVLISGSKMPTQMTTMSGYTQLEKNERFTDTDPIAYTPNSPSVN